MEEGGSSLELHFISFLSESVHIKFFLSMFFQKRKRKKRLNDKENVEFGLGGWYSLWHFFFLSCDELYLGQWKLFSPEMEGDLGFTWFLLARTPFI